jgi:hypothetical protein
MILINKFHLIVQLILNSKNKSPPNLYSKNKFSLLKKISEENYLVVNDVPSISHPRLHLAFEAPYL